MASTILVVDDAAFVRHRIKSILRQAGHALVDEGDGDAALRRATDPTSGITVAVVDLNLRGSQLAGIDLVALLLESGLPVVVVTQEQDPTARARCLSLGATAVLDKPIDEVALRQAVGSALRSLATGT